MKSRGRSIGPGDASFNSIHGFINTAEGEKEEEEEPSVYEELARRLSVT